MPLSIAAVSRFWRETILRSPRAWSYLRLYQCDSDNLVALFFRRGGRCPLHTFLPDNRRFELLTNTIARLECLSIDTRTFIAETLVFPNVKRLSIRDDGATTNRISLDTVHISRFPVLRHLKCGSEFKHDLDSWSKSALNIAPLETLSIIVVPDPAWIKIIQSCNTSLKSLMISYCISGMSIESPDLTFLVLEYLEISDCVEESGRYQLKFSTPCLKSYVEQTEEELIASPLHRDLRTVKYTYFDYVPNLAAFPHLHILQMGPGLLNGTVLAVLSVDPSLCPEMDSIQTCSSIGLDLHLLEELNQRRARSIRVEVLEWALWEMGLPGAIKAYQCEPHEACSAPPDYHAF